MPVAKRTNASSTDDMAEILDKMIRADVLVLASPVYFYSDNAQIKTVLDRTLTRWTELKDKKCFYILTAGEDDRSIMKRSVECFRGFAGANSRAFVWFEHTENAFGHVIVAHLNEHGFVNFGDPQSGEIGAIRCLSEAKLDSVKIMRVDELKFTDLVKRCCANRE